MNAMEDELRASLAEAAERVPTPRCDAQLLAVEGRRAAHQSRVHTVWWSAAGVAAAFAVVVGSTAIVRLADDGAPAQPATHTPTTPVPQLKLAELPHGAPPAIPYWVDGRLHVGTHSRQMQAPQTAITAGGTTLDISSSTGGYQIQLLRGLNLVTLGTSSVWPAVRSDGLLAAWETDLGKHAERIQLWDLQSRTMVASRDFRSQAHCCDAPSLPVGIDANGRVYIWDGGRPLVWDHWTDSVDVIHTGASTDLNGAWGGGPEFLVETISKPGRTAFGTVDEHKQFHSSGAYPTQEGVWSPGGSLVAYTNTHGAVVVLNALTAQAVEVPLTAGSDARFSWESDGTLLVRGLADGDASYWTRYDVDTRRLETTAVFPSTAHVVVPDNG